MDYELETREKIIEVAVDQFTRLGVKYVTMDDIARMGGVSKKTIYQEFRDKGDLVYEAFSQALKEDKQVFLRLVEEEPCPIKHFVKMSSYIRERFSQINPLVLGEIQRYYPKSWALYEDFKENCAVKGILDILKRGQKEGFFRPELNMEILANMRMEQLSDTFDPLKFPPSKFNILEVQVSLLDHFIHGVLTEKGRELFYQQINNQD
ncbi:TetR/AcrR family transcriptional regulator [Echinicola jeungdonensis]|uniref:TetR/AcrR family transcriptional regulator n=1 Tax=Echinicola jeungdonensis TaxID=709343 RepID=A0ABV5J567_9BACT|nr:TetR/AcrR family transcriptional regulator [Echinicola jeungdonensis]MDN3668148.1 TetR/AcrR family transcriptional regulator [Echinicola jeungdonensis]